MFRFQSDRLKTKQKLGSGRSGAVFPYQKDSQDFKWVVKRIRADDTDALLSSLPEIVLGFSCDHSRIVPIKGYFIEQDSNGESFNIYMKLPRMEITLLDEFKKRLRDKKQYSEEEIICHFYSLVSGLEYLHNKRIYHGDIKPNNLLLDQSGTLHIADVGIAKHVEEGDEYQTVTEKIGTYQYSAPEILGSERKDIKKEALAKADIWSLGVIVLELCVFDLKLLNSSDREETRKRIEKHLENLEGKFNSSLIALVKRLLNLDPKERSDIAQIKDDLEKNFSDILSEDLLILGKAPLSVHVDNKSEDQIQVLNQQIQHFETERKQWKEIMSQFESDLSQQKQQYEQKIQVLASQNHLNARQKESQQENENRILQEKMTRLEQELQQQKNQLLSHLNIIKDKENKLSSYEQKIIALEKREQVVSERFKEEKNQLLLTKSHLEQMISQQNQKFEGTIRNLQQQIQNSQQEREGFKQQSKHFEGEALRCSGLAKKLQDEIKSLQERHAEEIKNLNNKIAQPQKLLVPSDTFPFSKSSNSHQNSNTRSPPLFVSSNTFPFSKPSDSHQNYNTKSPPLFVSSNTFSFSKSLDSHQNYDYADERKKEDEKKQYTLKDGVDSLKSIMKNCGFLDGSVWAEGDGLLRIEFASSDRTVRAPCVTNFLRELHAMNYKSLPMLEELGVDLGLNEFEKNGVERKLCEEISENFNSIYGYLQKCWVS